MNGTSRCDGDFVPTTVGILYPGELGTAIGELLIDQSIPVCTTLEGRSSRTSQRAHMTRLQVMGSVEELAVRCKVILSLVPAEAAMEVAERYIACRHLWPGAPIYVDANSIAPRTARFIGKRVRAAGGAFVDAAIHGAANQLHTKGTLFLSGAQGKRVASLFGSSLHCVHLGNRVGAASMMQMLLGGLSNGLVSLFLEIGLTAHHASLSEEFLRSCRQYYPGVMTVLEQLVPTDSRHVKSRLNEVVELKSSMQRLGLRPGIVREAEQILQRLNSSEVDRRFQERQAVAEVAPTLSELLSLIAAENPLMKQPRPVHAARG